MVVHTISICKLQEITSIKISACLRLTSIWTIMTLENPTMFKTDVANNNRINNFHRSDAIRIYNFPSF